MSEIIRDRIIDEIVSEATKHDGKPTDKSVKLIHAYFNHISTSIGNAIGGINIISAPFIVAALEMYAKSVRESFPEAEEVINAIKRLPGLTEIKKQTKPEKRW